MNNRFNASTKHCTLQNYTTDPSPPFWKVHSQSRWDRQQGAVQGMCGVVFVWCLGIVCIWGTAVDVTDLTWIVLSSCFLSHLHSCPSWSLAWHKHQSLKQWTVAAPAAAKFPKSQCLLCGEVGWSGWWGGVIFPGTTTRKMASLDKLCIIHHPEGAKVVFIAHKTLVQWQIGADRVLYTQTTKKEKRE